MCLVGCSLPGSLSDRLETAAEIAHQANLQPFKVRTSQFILQGYSAIRDLIYKKQFFILKVMDWHGSRFTKSLLILRLRIQVQRLAASDLHRNVIYLARPCQYLLQENLEPLVSRLYGHTDVLVAK